MRAMPTVARLNTCKITMYAVDHLPPHFHVIANDGREALVEISTLQVLAGNAGRAAQTEALAWAAANQQTLNNLWQTLNP